MTELISKDARTRHAITNDPSGSSEPRIVGTALRSDGDDHYVVFLRVLPDIPFYLVPCPGAAPDYLLFSGKCKRTQGRPRFFNQMGTGMKLWNKNAVELRIPELNGPFLLDLDAQAQRIKRELLVG